MKTIPLSQGRFALVDDIDYESLSSHKWCMGKYYAMRTVRAEGNDTTIAMHRQILSFPSGKEIDHINGNQLDNRRSNLRTCTHSENQRNSKRRKNNKSGYKGVCWCSSGNKWKVQLRDNGKVKCIGFFTCLIKAARAYDKAAKEMYGEFAWLNFPEE
jgi:hypothetical protein